MSAQNINDFRECMFAILLSQKRILQRKVKAMKLHSLTNRVNMDAYIDIANAGLEDIEEQLIELQTPAPVQENKPEEYGISEDVSTELYNKVHTPIMDARITIAKVLRGSGRVTEAQVDAVLSNLCQIAPQAAIDYFKIKK